MIPVVLLMGSFARAADCAPLPEAGLRDLVAEAKAAVDRDDLVSFAEARRNLFHDLPCLEGPLPVDAWARFLLDEAVVGYALGEGWEAPLGTALTLTDLPRAELPQELRDWVAVPRPAVGAGSLAEGAFLLNGRLLDSVPDLTGVHVVQRQEGGLWTTRVLRDTPFPDDWRAPAVVPAPAPVPLPPVAHPSRQEGPTAASRSSPPGSRWPSPVPRSGSEAGRSAGR